MRRRRDGDGALAWLDFAFVLALVLEVLLDGVEVLLRRRQVARLQILSQLAEGLRNGVAALRCRRRVGLWRQILQRREIRLRRRKISRLQVLAQLLKLLLSLLKIILNALSVEKAAAGNARN